MPETVKEIIIPKWLSKKKDNIGPRIKRWDKKKETDKAILISLGGADGENEYWLPKSQVEYNEYETNTFDDYQEDDEEDDEEDDYEKAYPGIEMEGGK